MKYIAYFRVSTKRQGKSGLGLDAQKEILNRFIAPEDRIIDEYIEVESGKKNNRPALNRALLSAQQHNAKLLIAKLDRLSRNVGFIFQLKEANVDFVACDIPEMNTLSIGMVALVAQHERETISQRIKDALAQKKQRGESLGTPENLDENARLKGLRKRQENAYNNIRNKQSGAVSVMYRERGMTLQAIADKLNEDGYRTRYGKLFQPRTVKNLIDRYGTNS